MEPAEFLVKIIIICVLIVGILSAIVASSQFEGIVRSQDSERLAIDLAHAASAMPCLTEKVLDERRKGILLESELNKYDGSKEACIELSALWNVQVTDGERTWTMGHTVSGKTGKKTVPVAIKRTDGTVVPGKLTAEVKVVE